MIGGTEKDIEEYAIYIINNDKQITFETILKIENIKLKFLKKNYFYNQNLNENKLFLKIGILKLIQYMKLQQIK